MSSPPVPREETDKENVCDVSQDVENVPDAIDDDSKDTATEQTTESTELNIPNVNTDPSTDKDDGLQDVNIEEGIKEETRTDERKRSVAPMRSPSQLGRNPRPERRPLWLWMLIIMVVASVIGAVIITAISATRGGMSKVEMGFLIFFCIIIVCVVPIACYTRANFFAMGLVH